MKVKELIVQQVAYPQNGIAVLKKDFFVRIYTSLPCDRIVAIHLTEQKTF